MPNGRVKNQFFPPAPDGHYSVSDLLDEAFGNAIGSALVRGANTWSGLGAAPVVDAPAAGAVTCNFAAGGNHSVTMAASTTVTLSNMTAGQEGRISLIQGGSGSYTPTFSPALDFGTAGTPTWSTAVGKKDIVEIYYDGTTYNASVFGLGY
jgi:hypothetical protein